MPLLAYIPVLVLLAGWIYQMGRLIKALEGVEKIAAHLEEKVDDHETRISRMEGRAA